jgi:hypothetical protein
MEFKELKQRNPSDEVFDFLLSAPSPEAVLELRPSAQAQERLRYLLDGNRQGALNDAELEAALQLEHFVRGLKIRAAELLASRK